MHFTLLHTAAVQQRYYNSIDAARARCTLGEISLALEAKWGRHKLLTSVVHGAYSASYDSAGVDKEYEHVLAEVTHQ
jgi:methylmalonyl-CoA mutase